MRVRIVSDPPPPRIYALPRPDRPPREDGRLECGCQLMLNRCILFLIAAVIGAACANPPPLANARESAEAVAAAVLEALAGEDRAALEALALNEAEFR